MSYHQDWLMRQIEAIAATLTYLLTGRKTPAATVMPEEQTLSDTNSLYRLLRCLTQQGRICEAENLLFDAMDRNDPEAAKAGVRFYADINQLSDTALEAQDFSREEILSGLKELCRRCKLDIF